jgi:hypothetical protein
LLYWPHLLNLKLLLSFILKQNHLDLFVNLSGHLQLVYLLLAHRHHPFCLFPTESSHYPCSQPLQQVVHVQKESSIDDCLGLVGSVGKNSLDEFGVCLFHDCSEGDSGREGEKWFWVVGFMELHEFEEIVELVGVDCIESELFFN